MIATVDLPVYVFATLHAGVKVTTRKIVRYGNVGSKKAWRWRRVTVGRQQFRWLLQATTRSPLGTIVVVAAETAGEEAIIGWTQQVRIIRFYS